MHGSEQVIWNLQNVGRGENGGNGMENWKKVMLQGVICVGLLCVIWGGYFLVSCQINRKNEIERIRKLAVTTDNKIVTHVENFRFDGENLVLSGWGLRTKSEVSAIDIILKQTEGNKEALLQTESYVRDDVNKYFDSEWEFGKSGFKAKISESQLERDKCYEILLVLAYENDEMKEERKKVETNWYIYNGEVLRYNPIEFEKPEVDSELVEVIDEGNLCTYDTDKRIWVYEYGGNLFWIVDFSILGDLSKRPEIPMFVYTSQRDKKLEDKVEADYYGYYLKEEDLRKNIDSNYFVCKMEIPKNVSITSIQTGVYHNIDKKSEWKWEDVFSMGFLYENKK